MLSLKITLLIDVVLLPEITNIEGSYMGRRVIVLSKAEEEEEEDEEVSAVDLTVNSLVA